MDLDLLLTIVLGVLIGMLFTLGVTNMPVLVCAFALGVVVGVALMHEFWRRAVEGSASEYSGDDDDDDSESEYWGDDDLYSEDDDYDDYSGSEYGFDDPGVCFWMRGGGRNKKEKKRKGMGGYKRKGRKGRRKGGKKQGKKREPHGGKNGWRDRFGWGRFGSVSDYRDGR